MAPLKNNEPKFTKVCTKEDLIRVRDTEQKSWAKVAQELGLGSPGAARRAYTLAVRPHTESVLVSITGGTAKVQPVHLADANLATIRRAIVGKTIVVQRPKGTEEITVAKVTSLKGGTVNFNDGSKARSVKAEVIIATK